MTTAASNYDINKLYLDIFSASIELAISMPFSLLITREVRQFK